MPEDYITWAQAKLRRYEMDDKAGNSPTMQEIKREIKAGQDVHRRREVALDYAARVSGTVDMLLNAAKRIENFLEYGEINLPEVPVEKEK